jgi:tetratricopeptide (TPR) repeat protein
MDKKKVFDILGIGETRDVNIIKKAYRSKLIQVNPEDNPEGFKLLREAYEEAVRLINVDEEAVPETPVGRWIKKVEYVYSKLSSRIDTACWEELFKDEVCSDFDTEKEAREAFLEFLMDNFRLPSEVWLLIEERFQLERRKEELCEKLPVSFVDFITGDIEKKGWMDFTLFEGDAEGDVDEFINLYLSLRNLNDSNKMDGAEELFERLAEIDLRHPYLEAEKIRFYLIHKKPEEAREVVELLRGKKSGDLYSKYYIAEYYSKIGELEKAYEECCAILEENPDYFGAKVLLADYYLAKGNYKEAKERYLQLLEFDNYNDNLREGLQKTNEGLIKSMKEELEREPSNSALRLELAWCFYQNKLFDEITALLNNLVIDDEIYYDYNNLMSRIYLELEDYEKAFPFVQKWLEEILKTKDDGTIEIRKRLQRLGLAYFFMGKCYFYFAMKKENSKEDMDQFFKFIDLAVEVEENNGFLLQYLLEKAQILLSIKEDKLCIDACTEIIRRDKGYYPAYLIRQEAYFNLQMGEEVIDDYYNAVEIYPGNVAPYLFAIRVYQIYGQYEDAAAAINRAKEAEIESRELLLIELKNKRFSAVDNEERKKVVGDLEKLYVKAQEEPGDLKNLTDILNEQALCYYDMEDYDIALVVMEKILNIEKSIESLELKGDILYRLNKYGEAIDTYSEILKSNSDYVEAYYKIGLSWSALGEDGERYAVDNYLKVTEIDPQHQYVYSELKEIYKKHYLQHYQREDYEKAIQYAKLQVEANPSCYYYTDLGLMYLEAYDMEEAIKAFEEAIKCDEGNAYPYNNMGYIYKVLGEFDKSYEYYKMAIERIDDDDLIPYWNMAINYRSTGQFEKAVEILEEIAERDEESLQANKRILEVYKQMKAWDQALEQTKKISEIEENGQMDYLLHTGDIYSLAEKGDESLPFYEQALKEFSKNSKPYIKMGSYMLWIEKDKKKALKYYKKAYKIARRYDNESIEDALQNIISALKELGKEKKGIRYLKKIYKFHRSCYGSVEASLSNPEYRKVRLYYLALNNYNAGQYEKSQEYMEQMKNSLNCAQCTYCTCYEYLELEGLMLELRKDYTGALEKYMRALDIAPDNIHYLSKIKELRKKTE